MNPYYYPGLVNTSQITRSLIENAVLGYFNVTFKEIVNKDRHMELKEKRQILTYFYVKYLNKIDKKKNKNYMSLQEIGRMTGFNHATLIHSYKRVKDLCEFEKITRERVENIELLISKI